MSNTVFTFVIALSYVLGVTAESHTVRFVNKYVYFFCYNFVVLSSA